MSKGFNEMMINSGYRKIVADCICRVFRISNDYKEHNIHDMFGEDDAFLTEKQYKSVRRSVRIVANKTGLGDVFTDEKLKTLLKEMFFKRIGEAEL